MNYPQSELFEKLAAIEHERWSHWQEYLHSRGVPTYNGLLFAKEAIEHWERQIRTPYAELSEREKNSDRDEVMKYWDLVKKE